MAYHVDDCVVLNAHGVGRIAGLVTKRFGSAALQEYYEVATEHSTVWVAVDSAEARGLRAVTGKADLDRYREVLRGRPTTLTVDHRQRRLELQSRQRLGTFQSMCELVRDLSARSWHATLNEVDTAMLRQAQAGLCEEWAAAGAVALPDANAEVATLLQECRQAHQG